MVPCGPAVPGRALVPLRRLTLLAATRSPATLFPAMRGRATKAPAFISHAALILRPVPVHPLLGSKRRRARPAG